MALTVTVPGHSFAQGDVVYLADIIVLEATDDDGNPVSTTDYDGLYVITNVSGNILTLVPYVAVQTADVSGDIPGALKGVTLNDDGTKIYILGVENLGDYTSYLYEYPLSTAYDLSTIGAQSAKEGIELSSSSDTHHFKWKPDGTVLWVLDITTSTPAATIIYQHSVSTAWDLSTIQDQPSFDAMFFELRPAPTATLTTAIHNEAGNNNARGTGFMFNDDGTKLFVAIDFTDEIYEFSLSTAWDITTVSSSVQAAYTMPGQNLSNHIHFSPDGTKVFGVGGSGASTTLSWGDLTTAYDPSTGSFGAADVGTMTLQDPNAGGLSSADGEWSPDCRNWFVANANAANREVQQYTLNAADTDCTPPEVLDVGDVYIGGGQVLPTTTSSPNQVPHLEGETVKIVADGTITEGTVTDGAVSHGLAGRVHIGLPYIADVETLNITQSRPGAGQGRFKSLARVAVRFFKSVDTLLVGPNSSRLTAMTSSASGELIGDGENEGQEIYIEPTWETTGRVFLRQVDPSPFTILAVIPEFEGEDDAVGGF